MRRLLITLNLVVAILFIAFMAYTIFAKQHLESLAREFVTEKTVVHSKSLVKIADKSLDSSLVNKLLPKNQKQAIKNEIEKYWEEPTTYIKSLMSKKKSKVDENNPNPIMKKIVEVKNKIRAYYNETLASLIFDLRIFAGSNIMASLIAALFAYRPSRDIKKTLIIFSFLTFVSVIYCSSMYIEEMTFFRILFKTHLGFAYPCLIILFTVGLYWEYHRELHFFAGNEEDRNEIN